MELSDFNIHYKFCFRGRIKQNYNFDFFNYAGIDRSVLVYKTPRVFIDDIEMNCSFTGTTGNNLHFSQINISIIH